MSSWVELSCVAINGPLSLLVSHTNYSPPVSLLICAHYCTVTPLHALYGRLINFSSMFHDFPPSLVKDYLVTWLQQSGMVRPLNIILSPTFDTFKWRLKLAFSASPLTPLPCCPPSDCQRLWFSIITELACIINACKIIILCRCPCFSLVMKTGCLT